MQIHHSRVGARSVELHVGGGVSGKVDAPLFFSRSDSGRLRRQCYLRLPCREGGGAPGHGGAEAAVPDRWRPHLGPSREENQQLSLLPCPVSARVPGSLFMIKTMQILLSSDLQTEFVRVAVEACE